MPRLNITYAQVDIALLDNEDWLYTLNERQQLLYIKLLLVAGRTKNRISNSLKYLKQSLNYKEDEATLGADLETVERVMKDYTIKPKYIIFKGFWKRYSYVAKEGRGSPREVPGKSPGDPNRKERKGKETEENIKNSNTHKLVFDHWNGLEIMVHKKLSDKMRRAVNGRLNDGHQPADITQAITNYAIILKSNEYWFTHTWTLYDFINRGFEKFLDFEIVKTNYRKDGRYGKGPKPGAVKGDPGKYKDRDTKIDSAS